MFSKNDVFPKNIYRIIDQALNAKSKGLFKLHPQRCYTLPYAHVMVIDDQPEAKMDQAINLADDLQNALSKYGIFQGVTVRPFPLRVEVDRKDAQPVHLSKWWGRLRTMSTNDGGFSPAVIYRGSNEVLMDVAFSNQANTHVGIFGTTGSGKTVIAISTLLSLAYRNDPGKLGIVICDKTGKNYTALAGLPHLMMPIAVTLEECEAAIHAVRVEMLRRQSEGDNSGHRIILVVDEFSTLLDQSESITADIMDIAQIGRNQNINLVVCAQKMTVSVPTVISNNVGCRFTGRIADPADAKRTGGQQSQAHRLPAGRGAFEFNNGIVSARAQGLLAGDVDQMLGDIAQRWNWMQSARLEAGKKPVVENSQPVASKKADPAFLEACRAAGVSTAGAVRRVYQDMFGKQLAHNDAVNVLSMVAQ
jgi:DNA segregation ATPase FtsK/SpoIIIE-like protein